MTGFVIPCSTRNPDFVITGPKAAAISIINRKSSIENSQLIRPIPSGARRESSESYEKRERHVSCVPNLQSSSHLGCR